MADVKEILKVVNETDKVMTGTIGNSQNMLSLSIRRLEKKIMATYQDLTVGANGNLIGPRVNLKQSQKIHKKLVGLFEEEYGTGVRRAMKGYSVVDKAIGKEFRAFDHAIDFTSIDADMVKTLKEQAYAEYVQFGTAAQERIAQAMYDTVSGSGSFSDLQAFTRGILLGGVDARGRSMAAYATQWANDGIMNYHQSVTLKKANDADLRSFLYYGDIITTSRQFCIDRVGKVYSKKQINSWDDMGWQGKAGPPMTYRGGYNCRHHWHPVKQEWIPEGEIPIEDIYKEQGITIPRGLTIPQWPTKPGTLSKKVVKTGPKAAAYKDPYDRWVPINGKDAGAAEWNSGLLQYGQEFAELEGLGPCGPVADNIVQVLRGHGKDARVMYVMYNDGVNEFPHYVAVELNKAGDVVKIWDPTNPFLTNSKRILKVDPKKYPKNYFGEDWEPDDIYKAGDYAHTDHQIYDKSQFDWFKSKMLKPVAAKPPLKGMPPAKPKGRPKFVPVTERIAGQKATGKLIQEGVDDNYPTKLSLAGDSTPIVRFNHKGTRAAHPKNGYKPDAERAAILYGKTTFPVTTKIRVRAINTFNEQLAVLQDRAAKLGMPRIRGAQFTTTRPGASMAMGDGVYWVNVNTINRRWDEFGAASKAFKIEKLSKAVTEMKASLKAATTAQDKKLYKKWIAEKQKEIKAVEAGHIKGFKGTSWKTGDALHERGSVGTEYFNYGHEKVIYEMEHEWGHHLHQTLFMDGSAYQYRNPYMEEWIKRIHDFSKDNGMLAPTKYAEETVHEWFAENYALWRTDVKTAVNRELVPLFEMLDEVEAGDLSLSALKGVLDDPFTYDDMVL